MPGPTWCLLGGGGGCSEQLCASSTPRYPLPFSEPRLSDLRFMESELDLNDIIQEMHVIATMPDLYHLLVELNAVQSLLGLLGHDNTDILHLVKQLLREAFYRLPRNLLHPAAAAALQGFPLFPTALNLCLSGFLSESLCSGNLDSDFFSAVTPCSCFNTLSSGFEWLCEWGQMNSPGKAEVGAEQRTVCMSPGETTPAHPCCGELSCHAFSSLPQTGSAQHCPQSVNVTNSLYLQFGGSEPTFLFPKCREMLPCSVSSCLTRCAPICYSSEKLGTSESLLSSCAVFCRSWCLHARYQLVQRTAWLLQKRCSARTACEALCSGLS